MRITSPIPVLAFSAGLLAPATPAQGGMTEQMREEIRSIVREEVRAALRDLRADLGAASRGQESRKTDRKETAEVDRKTDRKRSGDRARRGIVVQGDDEVRWIARPEVTLKGMPDGLRGLQVELDRIDDLLDDIDVQLKTGLKDLKIEALPQIRLRMDTELEDLREKLHEKLKGFDTLDGIRVFLKGDDEDVKVLDLEALGDDVKVLDLEGLRKGDLKIEGKKVEGKAKVRVWTDGVEVLDKTFEVEGVEPGAFKVWVEDGKVHVDKDGDVRVFRSEGGGDGKVEVEVRKAGDQVEKKPQRRLVRRRTMV